MYKNTLILWLQVPQTSSVSFVQALSKNSHFLDHCVSCGNTRILMLSNSTHIIGQVEQIFSKPITIPKEQVKSKKENPLCKRFFHEDAEGDFLNLFNGLNLRILSQNEQLLKYFAENYKIEGQALNLQILKYQIASNFKQQNKSYTLPSYISTPIDQLALQKSVLLLHYAYSDQKSLHFLFNAIESVYDELKFTLHLSFPLNFVIQPQLTVPKPLHSLIPKQSYHFYKDTQIDYQNAKSLLIVSADQPGRIRIDEFEDFNLHVKLLEDGEISLASFRTRWSSGVQSARSFFSEVAFQMGYFEKFGA